MSEAVFAVTALLYPPGTLGATPWDLGTVESNRSQTGPSGFQYEDRHFAERLPNPWIAGWSSSRGRRMASSAPSRSCPNGVRGRVFMVFNRNKTPAQTVVEAQGYDAEAEHVLADIVSGERVPFDIHEGRMTFTADTGPPLHRDPSD